MTGLAWGARVSAAFRERVTQIGAGLGSDPSDLMAVMGFESGYTFSPAVRNAAGSGAIGLIQFMPQTCSALDTTTEEMAAMTAEQQLEFVADFLRPYTGRLHNLGDVYGAVLWPAMIGKPDSYIVFDKANNAHPQLYLENRGLDVNGDGQITRAEAWAGVAKSKARGLLPPNVWAEPAAFPAATPHPLTPADLA